MATLSEPKSDRIQGNIFSRSGSLKFYAIGVIVLAAVAYLGFTGLQGSTAYYLTPTELKARASALEADRSLVRLAGKVVPGSTVKGGLASQTISFSVSDGTETIPVVYKGIVPDTYREGYEVVSEGHYSVSGGRFEATNLLVKCPSKYESGTPSSDKGN